MTCEPDTIRCQIERIADAANSFDLNAFVSTLLATLIGAGVAAGVTWWLAERDRPRPMWSVKALAQGPLLTDTFTVRVDVTNIGDGPAYNACVLVHGTDVTGTRKGNQPVVAPGEKISASFGMPGSGPYWADGSASNGEDHRTVDVPSDAAVTVSWHQPPRRAHTRRKTLKITEVPFGDRFTP